MAERKNTFLLKRSNVPGKVPSPGDLKLGEVALNTADAILYASGTTANSILPIGWDRISRTGDTVTGDFNIFGDVKISGSSLPGGYALSVSGDTNFSGDVYVGGDLYYNGDLFVTGNTVIESGLTANTIYTDYIDFNTGATVTSDYGRIYWDNGTGTLNISIGDAGTGIIDLQVGQEEIVRVYNAEATSLQKGEIVYVSGSQGNRPSVKRASAVDDGYSVTTLGMVDSSINSGAEGYITTFGVISNLNTLGLTGGTPVWLSPTTPGAYTSTKPQAPYHTVLIGYVVRVSATVGSIFINISNGWELDELHDVRISAATSGDLLIRKSYNGSPVWVNSKTLNGSYNVTGGLTANTISATTYLGISTTDIYVTGGTFSTNTLTLKRNDGNNVVVTGFTSQPVLNDGEVFVGDSANTAQSVAMTGDVNINNSGVTTIQNGVVTYAKMQTVSQPSLLGSIVSGGTVQEIATIDAYIPSGSTIATLLNNDTNWTQYGNYTGTSITNSYQGQSHYNDNYWYTAVQDNVWIRLIRG